MECKENIFLIGTVGGGVQSGPLGIAATNRPILQALGDYDDGEISGMIGKGNRSTRRKPTPVPLCPPQIPRDSRTRTRAAAVGSQRLTAWATARPRKELLTLHLRTFRFLLASFDSWRGSMGFFLSYEQSPKRLWGPTTQPSIQLVWGGPFSGGKTASARYWLFTFI
jgi:hypothetical protein